MNEEKLEELLIEVFSKLIHEMSYGKKLGTRNGAEEFKHDIIQTISSYFD